MQATENPAGSGILTYYIARSSFLRGAIYAANLIGCIWFAPSAVFACGQSLTVDDIQHGIMPSEANLPCKNNSAPAAAPQRRVIQRAVPLPRHIDQKGAAVGRAMITIGDEYLEKRTIKPQSPLTSWPSTICGMPAIWRPPTSR